MAYARATYPGGGSQTDVSGQGGIGYGGSPYGGGGWLEDLAKRRALQQLAMGEEQLNQMRAGSGPQLGAWDSPQGLANKSGRLGLQMMQDQAAQSGAQTQAMMGPAPTRMMFGPNVIPGRTLDPMAMSGAQRQMFLPQGSQEIGGPVSDIERATYAQGRGQQRADMAGIQDVAGMMVGGQPGFAGSLGGGGGAPAGGGGSIGGGAPAAGPSGSARWFQPGPFSSPGVRPTPRYSPYSQDRSNARLFNPQYGGIT